MSRTRITLTGTEPKSLDGVCDELSEIAKKTGAKYSGPVYMPTKKVVVPTRRSPCGQGTATWDKYEMRLHRRLFDIDSNERAMKYIVRLAIPDDVFIELRVT
ncbi:MAG: 30S ribosomal protein S10 [Candidatus Geothermarchaeales archaeon]